MTRCVGDGGAAPSRRAPALQWRRARVRLLGTELWGDRSQSGRTPALRGAWYASVGDTMFNRPAHRYRGRYGANPYRLASLGYDAVC